MSDRCVSWLEMFSEVYVQIGGRDILIFCFLDKIFPPSFLYRLAVLFDGMHPASLKKRPNDPRAPFKVPVVRTQENPSLFLLLWRCSESLDQKGSTQPDEKIKASLPNTLGIRLHGKMNFFHIQSIFNKEREGAHYKDPLVSPQVI